MLLISVRVLVLGQNFHDTVVNQEAKPGGGVSMLLDKLKTDFSILSAGWIFFFLYLPFHHVYVKFPDSFVGFCGANNGGRGEASSIFGGPVHRCGHGVMSLRFDESVDI